MYIVREVISESDKHKFLSLPKKLYKKSELVQDYNLEKNILDGTHCLSNNFKSIPLICLDEKEEIVARCIITFYENDDNAYVGFFECLNHFEISKALLNMVDSYARRFGKTNIIGPIDCSFWIKYRFKRNQFGKVLGCEPYNKEYYHDLWTNYGYVVTDNYYSNHYGLIDVTHKNEKYVKRLKMMKEQGYIFRNVTKRTFYDDLEQIYYLLTKLYSSFPCYKDISFSQFKTLFSSLKYALNYDMVELVFKDDKLVGFFINVPDYGNITYQKLSIPMIVKMLYHKKFVKNYILLYMGVDETCLGLGSALAEITKTKLAQKQCTSIGALIHESKVTGGYFKELICGEKLEYALYSKKVDDL